MALLADYLAFAKAQSPRKRIISHVLVIYFATLLLGVFIGLLASDVIPSTAGTYCGVICGALNGLIWIALLERNLRNPALRDDPNIRNVRDIRILKYRASRVPFFLGIGFAFGYAAFAWGYPWLYNRACGSVVTRTFTVTGWQGATGRTCRRPEIGYNTFVLAPHALCVRSDAQARMPPGASIRVVGPQSALGLNAREIYSIPRQSTISAASPVAYSSKTAWVRGGDYRLKVTLNTGSRASREPVLLVTLHGDLGTGAQDELAARAAANNDVIGVGLLRPGYTDSAGDTSDGQKGLTTGDNYNSRNTDAIAAAVVELKRQFHPRKTVLAGHSGGAAITANILGRHPDIADAALLISCPCDVDAWRHHMLQRTHFEGFRGKIETLSPIELVKGLSDRVVVDMIVGTKDEVAPPILSGRYRDAAVAAGKNVRLMQLDGKDHEIALDPAVLDALLPMLK